MPPRPPSDLKRVTAQYHAAVQGLQDNALADLQGRWQGVQATLDLKIRRLTDAIAAAQARGDTVNVAWLTQAQRLEQLRQAVQGDVSAFADGAADIVANAMSGAADLGQAAAQAALAATVPPGVNYTFGVPPSDVTETLAGALQPGSPLNSLFGQMGSTVAAFAQQALFTGVALGENPRQIAQRLQWATNMAPRRAEVIARTETMRSWRHAQFANYQANRDVVQQWMWAADFGPRCCGACIAMDGTFHDVDTELDDHICGRCSAIPITRSWADILADGGMSQEEIDALDLTETSGMAWAQSRESGESWLQRQSVEIQNQILGPAKAEAWRQGAFPLERVVGVVHDPQWGSSIRELSLKQMGIDAQIWLQAARAAGNGSVLADETALQAAHAETSVTVAAEQRVAQNAEAKAAADEWYAQIQRSIAAGQAGGLTSAEAKAAADEWFASVKDQLRPGGLSVEDVARAMEQRFGLAGRLPDEEGFALKEPSVGLARSDLEGKSMAELRQIASDAGVSPARSKAETIDRILAKQQAKTPVKAPKVAAKKPTVAPSKAREKLAQARSALDDKIAQRELLYAQQHELVEQKDLLERQIKAQQLYNAANVKIAIAQNRAKIELYRQSLDRSDPAVQRYLKAAEAIDKSEAAKASALAERERLDRVMDELAIQGKQHSAEFQQAVVDRNTAAVAYTKAEKANLAAYDKLSRIEGVYKPEFDSAAGRDSELGKRGISTRAEDLENNHFVVAARAEIASVGVRLAEVQSRLAALDKPIETISAQIKRDLGQLDKLRAAVGEDVTAASLDTMRPFSDVIALPEGNQPPNRLMQKLDYKMREPRAVTKSRIIDQIHQRLKNNPAWQEYVARARRPRLGETYHAYIGEYASAADTKSAQLVADWIKKWGVGYRPGSTEWMAMQMAVKDEFGLDAVIHSVATRQAASLAAMAGHDLADLPAEAYYAENGAAIRALMRAMYDNTQAWFAEQGITEVEVFRGFGWTEDSTLVPKGIAWGPAEAPNYGVTDMEFNPFQSFSADINVSQGTGAGNGFAGGGFGGGDAYSLLVGAKVPVDRILGTAQTGFGAKLESEVVVMGRATDTVAYRAGTKVDAALLRQADEVAVSDRELVFTLGDEAGQVRIVANDDGTFTITNEGVVGAAGGVRQVPTFGGGHTFAMKQGAMKPGTSRTYKSAKAVNAMLQKLRIANVYVPPELETLGIREGEEAAAATSASAAVSDGLQAQVQQLAADATTSDAQDWLAQQLPEGARVDLMSLDAQTARLVGNALGNLLPELPQVADNLGQIAVQATRTNALAYVSPDGASLILNVDRWTDLSALAERSATYAESGWWVAQTPEQILGHEIGHAVQLNYGISDQTWSAALERVAAAGGDPLVSQYAGDKIEESFAETFALLVYGQPSEAQLPIAREMADLLRAQGLDYTTLRAAVGAPPLDLGS